MNLVTQLLTGAALTVVLGISTVALADQAGGKAKLHSIDHSGIRASVLLLDTGSADNGLVVSAQARGLDPNQIYISLMYDQGSVPRGPNACIPTMAGPMMVGMWSVDMDGSGILFAILDGDGYRPLGEIGTMSIRQVVEAPPPILQACGKVQRTRTIRFIDRDEKDDSDDSDD